MTRFAVRFALQDVEAIEPWGEPGNRSLSWFGLTCGGYCIETPHGRLLETPVPEGGIPEPWVNYQVARLFDDLLGAWPTIAEPLPPDIVPLVDDPTVNARIEAAWDTDDDEMVEAASIAWRWSFDRQVSLSYLASSPDLRLWRTGDVIRLRWVANPEGTPDCDDHWTVRRADCRFAFDEVADGMRTFAAGFLAQMRTRVDAIRRDGWTRDCALDVEALMLAQHEAEEWCAQIVDHTARTDWDATRAALRKIGAL